MVLEFYHTATKDIWNQQKRWFLKEKLELT